MGIYIPIYSEYVPYKVHICITDFIGVFWAITPTLLLLTPNYKYVSTKKVDFVHNHIYL